MESPNDRDQYDVDVWLDELEVEEIWITDRVEAGLEAITRYLEAQAAFSAYLHSHGLDTGDATSPAS